MEISDEQSFKYFFLLFFIRVVKRIFTRRLGSGALNGKMLNLELLKISLGGDFSFF